LPSQLREMPHLSSDPSLFCCLDLSNLTYSNFKRYGHANYLKIPCHTILWML
jgi:hypothetical protein